MFYHYLVVAFRALKKKKLASFVNVLGLTAGLVSAALILLFVGYELSYDKALPDSDRIYRVGLKKYNNGDYYSLATNYNAVAKRLRDDHSEVETSGRAFPTYTAGNCYFSVVRDGTKVRYQERSFYHADQTFLNIFSYPVIQGKVATALTDPYTAVITRSVAEKYFGSATEESLLNKIMKLSYADGEHEYRITAVIEDVPSNSHFPFTILLSMETYNSLYPGENFDDSWAYWDTYTYVKLKDNSDVEALATKFNSGLTRFKKELGSNDEVKDHVIFQPITSIHLESDLGHEVQANSNWRIIIFLMIMGATIMLLVWSNYIYLTHSNNSLQLKSVGVRKAAGASKKQLTSLFFISGFSQFIISLILTMAVIAVVVPWLSSTTDITLRFVWAGNTLFWVCSVGFLLFGCIVTIWYPSFSVSSLSVSKILKGTIINPAADAKVRKVTLVFQLSMTLFLFIAALLIFGQYQYMQNTILGVNISQVIVVPAPRAGITLGTEAYSNGVDVFNASVSSLSNVTAVATSTTIPGRDLGWGVLMNTEGTGNSKGVYMYYNGISRDVVNVLDLKFVAGENFLPNTDYTDNKTILNETAARLLGFKTPQDAIGKNLVLPGGGKKIIAGVLRDYNQGTLRRSYDPLYFINTPKLNEYFLIRTSGGDVSSTISSIQNAYEKAFPDNLFSSFFLDDYFNRQYIQEKRFSLLTSLFTTIAIGISILGMIATTSLLVLDKTKEIGIRKVVGASPANILLLLSKDIFLVISIAALIAWPLSYWVLGSWLETYSFRVSIGIAYFIIPTLTILLISFVTLTWTSLKVVTSNPVNLIKAD